MFKSCRQRWDFTSKIRGNWEPIQRYLAFDFGSAIHSGLEAYYEPSTWGNKVLMQRNAIDAFRLFFADLESKVRVGDIEIEYRFDEQVELGTKMLEYYFTWAPKQDVGLEPIFTEIEFEVPIPGLEGRAVYQGRIDLIVEVFIDGKSIGYFIVDHKTISSFGDFQWLWLDDQGSSYAWAIKQQLGLDIRGVIYNHLRKKPPHKPRMLMSGGFSKAKNQDTTFEVYLKAIRDTGQDPRWYRDILLYFKQNPKEFCRRTTVHYSEQQLDIVEERIRKEAREMINPDVVIYPTPSPWNCNGCRFFGPCIQVQEGREPSMENYERRS